MQNVILNDRLKQVDDLSQKERATTVFVVDDEPMVGEVVSVVLSMEGFNTRLFTSPTDALEAFAAAETKPELLITDLMMRPFDGLELIARCRESHPSLRAILYSGQADIEAIESRLAEGDAFLSKPFLPKELIQTVRASVARQAVA